MANLTKNEINDFRIWFKDEGDDDFSPEHNKWVVEQSIIAYDARRSLAEKKFREDMGERSDAVASLLKSIDGGKTTDALKYFGKKELARLRGEEILGQMRLSAAAMQRKLHAEKESQN